MVKNAINQHWSKKLKLDAAKKSSLKYLNLEAFKIGEVHPVWKVGSDPVQVTMASNKARILVQRYQVYGVKCAGTRQLSTCPLCKGPPETLEHFLLECPELQNKRTSHLKKLKTILPNIKDEQLLQLIIDSSVYTDDNSAERISRRMCYDLHNKRTKLLTEICEKNAM